MLNPKISIVIPNLNQGQFIEQSILSVLNQNYSNFELIIIDGGSTDNSVDIIKKYKSYISYWVSEPDAGQADAINKGLSKASGEFFNWLNSDDYLEAGALHAISNLFSREPQKKIACGYTRCFFEENGQTSHTYRMGIRKSVVETIMNVEMNQPGSFYRMDVIRELGFLNSSLCYVFDGELWFRFLCKYGLKDVGYTDALIANFRLHEKSKSVKDGFFEFYKEYLNIHLFLAIEMNLMPNIISYLKKEQYIDGYHSNKWDYHFIERDEFEKIFFERYKFLLYKDHQYQAAREGLLYYFKMGKAEKRFANAKLAIKLLLPNSVIDIIRHLNNRRLHDYTG